MKRWSIPYAVLVGGAVAGALDITFAISFAVYNGLTPERLLQIVASGLLGSAAFSGGALTAAVGLLCHFALSFVWMALFLLAARSTPALTAKPLLSAVLFGTLVFLAMRLVVLPLSAFPRPVTFQPLSTVLDLLSHIFLFGLPIVWATRKALGGGAHDASEMLFSYGTLQQPDVQKATFGRLLSGRPDSLPAYQLAMLAIDDPAVVETSGKTHHPIISHTGSHTDMVAGSVLAITAEELRNSDRYEVAAYRRQRVVLASGTLAWAYVDARDAPTATP